MSKPDRFLSQAIGQAQRLLSQRVTVGQVAGALVIAASQETDPKVSKMLEQKATKLELLKGHLLDQAAALIIDEIDNKEGFPK